MNDYYHSQIKQVRLPSQLRLQNTPTIPLQRGKTPPNECPRQWRLLPIFATRAPPPQPSVNFSSQPMIRRPKVSHQSCSCVILHCIAQIDKRTLHGVFFFFVNNQDTI